MTIVLSYSACSLNSDNRVVLCKYENIEVPADVTDVLDEDVKLSIRAKMMEKNILIPKNYNSTIIEYGDIVTITVSQENQSQQKLTIYIDDEIENDDDTERECSKQLVGKKLGQQYDVIIGDTLCFVSINEIFNYADMIDDKIAKEYFNMDSADVVREATKKDIIDHRIFEYIYNYIINNSNVLGYNSERDSYIRRRTDSLEKIAKINDCTIDKLLSSEFNTTLIEYQSEVGVFYDEYLILEELMRLENVKVSTEEFENELKNLQNDLNSDDLDALEIYGEEFIRYSIYYDKCFEILLKKVKL